LGYSDPSVTIKNMDIPKIFGRLAGRVWLHLLHPYLYPKTMSGKVTLLTALTASVAGFALVIGLFLNVNVPKVSADNVLTSVNVLNTPPAWTTDAQEQFDSATSTPTNAGDPITWLAIGTDSSNDNYWLLICKTSSAPTPNASAAPTCGGGVSNQWAVSSVTTSGTVARASTSTIEKFPFNNEKNDWYGWICDGNVSLPQCNAVPKQGIATGGPSPFFVDHPPVFTALSSTGNGNPGGSIVWSITATTTDTLRGTDKVRAYVCKANDFTYSSTTAACGAGGTWASSTLVFSNPTVTYTIPSPLPDKLYNAYVFVINNFYLAATSTLEASSSPYYVNDVAPTITAASISLVDPTSGGNVTLTRPNATSGPYQVKFTVADNNSCQNAASGNEISSVTANAYRSAIGSSSCRVSGDYNSNNCYPQASANTDFSCVQDGLSCTGIGDVDATFTCTFSLWYTADATDPSSQFPAQNWLASAQATDDNATTSGIVQASSGNELLSFLAFNVPQSTIAYGGLQPGTQIDPFTVATSTSLRELGNTGIDETLYGDTMCIGWTVADSCDRFGPDPTSQIPIANQKAATSTIPYGSGNAFTLAGSTTPVSVPVHIRKTTSTSSPQATTTLWAIKIPAAITVAGAYSGQNTITAVTSAAANW
jgi:hypothetical protein